MKRISRPVSGLPGDPSHPRRGAPLAAVGALIGAALAGAACRALLFPAAVPPAIAHPADPTGLATVTRQSLSSQVQVPATLGYAGSYAIVNQTRGTVTALPAVGQIVRQGEPLYQVDGTPVALLYGTTPAYRTLAPGLTGPDVAELNADLVALGDATTADIPPGTTRYTGATASAVSKLQAALGDVPTGTLALGQAVFAPGAVRVTALTCPVGSALEPSRAIVEPCQPLLLATSTVRQVSIALDAAQQAQVRAGDPVTITLPDNRTTPGVVASVGTVAATPDATDAGSGNGAPVVTVLVAPRDPRATGSWDEAPVYVTITTGRVPGALVVPVDALVARAGGTYAVEVVGARGAHRLVPVRLGLFDDANGLVQVRDPRLAAGMRVVVPAL